ncbi:MAG TPA: DUF881 domain-containing protein [Propionibacteriaceae bacterium]|nr:DUF881 domain-containing protein [Propionibacteriaceae bacterium]
MDADSPDAPDSGDVTASVPDHPLASDPAAPDSAAQGRLRRILASVAHHGRERSSSRPGRAATFGVLVLAGFMLASSAVASRGSDLRPGRNTDLAGLVQTEAKRNRELASHAAALRSDLADLSGQLDASGVTEQRLTDAARVAGLSDVVGPAVKVVLTDAPLSVKPPGVDEDVLVVHQQDIQLVANVLWASGAEAMTIQGQRVVSSTGIKCVGNTVVLHGVPYAPPYEITAIGNVPTMLQGIEESPGVAIYQQYVKAYSLGWSQQVLAQVRLPAFDGPLQHVSATVR